MWRSAIGLFLATAVMASLSFAHADLADDSLRLYAVDICQDPRQSWGPGRGLYLGNGLVLTAAHVIGSAARTKPSVCIAGGPACSTPDRSACSESSTWAPTAELPPNILCRHRLSALSYQLTIATGVTWILSCPCKTRPRNEFVLGSHPITMRRDGVVPQPAFSP